MKTESEIREELAGYASTMESMADYLRNNDKEPPFRLVEGARIMCKMTAEISALAAELESPP